MILSEKIIIEKRNIERYNSTLKENYKLPDFIVNNLSRKLRPYQIEAIENFLFFLDHDCLKNINSLLNNNQCLFHMATGSGKTMIMASVLLQFIKQGYKKFIFTTNSTNLIEKTKINFLDSNNDKLEFKKSIEIECKKIKIKQVDNFSKYSSDIEIIFTTIHNLHNRLNENKENSINMSDFKDHEIIILADEAHHFQKDSKNNKKDLEEENWEKTINQLLYLNQKNKLIEFTATLDLNVASIKNKYEDKIVYDYTLKKFREDGYSKEISLIKNDNKEDRILTSILISQFRKEIANKNNINLLPKLLFKCSGEIIDIEKEQKYILDLIKNLDEEKINNILENSSLSNIKKLKLFLEDEKIEDFLLLLKRDFNESKSLIVHSKLKDKEERLKIANNLDNESIRMVFAIDMLNEGWDVLSLFDIVKIDEIKKSNAKKTTISEVQLIGRGARIYPYSYKILNQELDKYKRKFDNNIEHDLRLLEDMNFYSANDNNYINEIKKELINIGLKSESEDIPVMIKIKNKDSNFIKLAKNVFSNEVYSEYDNNSLISDFDLNIELIKDFSVKEENILIKEENINLKRDKEININIYDFIHKYENKFILNQSLNMNSYYNMNNINKKFKIKTKVELVEDLIKLRNKINIKIINKELEDLNYNEKINIMNKILFELQIILERKRNKKIGKKDFSISNKIEEVFINYSKNQNNVRSFNTKIKLKNNEEIEINNKDLFYYDQISFDSDTELKLYELFDKRLESEKFLVIRNEVGFKLYNPYTAEDINNRYTTKEKEIYELNGTGFEPDFIVFRKDSENNIKQFFIEVKSSIMEEVFNNKWKEKLLLDITENNESFLEDNINYRICGIRFFTEKDFENGSKSENYINEIKY